MLLDFNGRPAPQNLVKFKAICDSAAFDVPLTAIVLRDGKHKTIEGLVFPSPPPVVVAVPAPARADPCVK